MKLAMSSIQACGAHAAAVKWAGHDDCHQMRNACGFPAYQRRVLGRKMPLLS